MQFLPFNFSHSASTHPSFTSKFGFRFTENGLYQEVVFRKHCLYWWHKSYIIKSCHTCFAFVLHFWFLAGIVFHVWSWDAERKLSLTRITAVSDPHRVMDWELWDTPESTRTDFLWWLILALLTASYLWPFSTATNPPPFPLVLITNSYTAKWFHKSTGVEHFLDM